MNDFPFEFTFLDGAAFNTYLDVASVSQEILSLADDTPFEVGLIVENGGSAIALGERIVFSGTPEQDDGVISDTWFVTLSGTPQAGERWSLDLGGDIYGLNLWSNLTVEQIAGYLVSWIDSSLDFNALVDGAVIEIRTESSASFNIIGTVTPAPSSTASASIAV